jgi:AcrR family transcriptional regulator
MSVTQPVAGVPSEEPPAERSQSSSSARIRPARHTPPSERPRAGRQPGIQSPTNQARRRQIVDAAVAVLADSGYARTSFARIAEHARLSSTRLISYHFAGKADLMTAVVTDVLGALGGHVGAMVGAEQLAADQLRAYIDGVVGFVDGHRAEMVALTEVMLGAGFEDGIKADESAAGHLEQILVRGQRRGEFRPFDAAVMAAVVQRSVDSLPFAVRANPAMDCAAYARELVELFRRATAADPR